MPEQLSRSDRPASTDRLSLSVDVVSDVVCPWCFVGQKRLDKAIAASDVDVTVRWRPYQLDPTIPPEGLDRKSYMEAKFGSGDRLRQAHERLESLGRDEGIDFAFDAITRAPNTLDAHRVIRWAGARNGAVQNRLAREIFQLYFERGADISDHAVLAGAAGEAGLDAAVVEAMLATDQDRDAVRREIETASRMGVTGVPCFLLDSRYAVVGAQDVETLSGAIRQIAGAKARGELDAEQA